MSMHSFMCFPSLTRNISLCAPTPLCTVTPRDEAARWWQTAVTCLRSSRCVCLCARHAQLHFWMEFSSCSTASGYALGSVQRLGDHQSSFESQSNSFPLFSIPCHSRQNGRLPGKCDALQAPFPRQVENFGCQATREFTAARRTGLWRRSSDTGCARSEVASAALHTSTTASVKYTPQIEVNPQPLRFDVPTILAGLCRYGAECYNTSH